MPPLQRSIRAEHALRSLRGRLPCNTDDGGFMLIEVMIALSLITVIMAAVSIEFVTGMVSTAHQRSLTNATQAAAAAVSQVRALDPSDLLTGRTQAAVTAERSALRAVPKLQSWISNDSGLLAFNDADQTKWATSSDNGGADKTISIAVPTVATPATGNTSQRVYRYLDCVSSAPTVSNPKVVASDVTTYLRNCSPVARTNGVANYLRLTVAVIWSGTGCPSAGCAFATSTLIDAHANPTFDINQPLPPAPVIASPGNQTVAVADTVSLQLAVQDGKGVAPFTWTITGGTLPTGLSISPAGLVSGTVGGSQQAATNMTFKVTDAFLREASITVSWAVLPKLQFSPTVTPPRSDITYAPISAVAFAATGGAGAAYTFSDPNNTLPPGLQISGAGVVTGTPTTAGTYSVTLVAADSSVTRTTTTSFTWTVQTPPLALTDPTAQTSTVSRAVSLQLAAAGGSRSYRYSSSALPAGLSLNASSGLISGTPTATSTTSVTATVTDTTNGATQSVTFSWRVVAAPTVTAPSTQNTTRGASVGLSVTSTCPNAPCTYTASNAPANIAINQTSGSFQGSPSASAVTSANVTVTITDASGATATSSAFRWNVYAPPTITTPSARQDTRTGTDSFTAGFACNNTPCTFSSSSLPKGLSINSSGVVSGTVASDAATSTTAKLTITDGSGISTTTGAFTWTIVDPATSSVTNRTSPQGVAATDDLSSLFSGGSGPFSYTVSSGSLPTGLTLNRTSGAVSGTTAKANTKTTGIKITATDSSGVVTTTAAFTWFVSDLDLEVPNYNLALNGAVSADLKSFTTGGTTPA